MSRKNMMAQIIKSFGFEDERTIWFIELCEEYPDTEHNNKCLEGIFGALINLEQYRAELEF